VVLHFTFKSAILLKEEWMKDSHVLEWTGDAEYMRDNRDKVHLF
jgi:hypothetical protein